MTLTVRMDKALEMRVAQEAKRRGMTKSEFVRDTLERSLGYKDPYELLLKIRSNTPMGEPKASENTGAGFRAKLLAKRDASEKRSAALAAKHLAKRHR
ncbi:MAG: hypothetical protein ACREFQ_03165 [Stellaceae bacterium]